MTKKQIRDRLASQSGLSRRAVGAIVVPAHRIVRSRPGKGMVAGPVAMAEALAGREAAKGRGATR